MHNYSFNIIVKKNNKHLFIGLVLSGLLLLTGCNAIFEKDISEKIPQVILPTHNDTLYSNQVHFKWVEMDGADFYNLQVVRPSFNDIDAFLLDSNINAEQFYDILPPGEYQFRLRGENGGYKSLYAGPYSFYVDSVSDLSAQFVSLNSPANGVYINGLDDVLLSWQNLYAADRYEYILKIGADFNSGSALDLNLNIATLSYTAAQSFFDVEGTYFWGIRGANVSSSTAYSSRSIYVDRAAPNDPELVSPANLFTHPIADPLTLKWTTGTDPGTVHAPVYSTVEISTSETFVDITSYENITADSLSLTFPSVGNYWWRVSATDGAGNLSEFYSAERQIIVE